MSLGRALGGGGQELALRSGAMTGRDRAGAEGKELGPALCSSPCLGVCACWLCRVPSPGIPSCPPVPALWRQAVSHRLLIMQSD